VAHVAHAMSFPHKPSHFISRMNSGRPQRRFRPSTSLGVIGIMCLSKVACAANRGNRTGRTQRACRRTQHAFPSEYLLTEQDRRCRSSPPGRCVQGCRQQPDPGALFALVTSTSMDKTGLSHFDSAGDKYAQTSARPSFETLTYPNRTRMLASVFLETSSTVTTTGRLRRAPCGRRP
jgi:hypothetical protein